MSSAELQNEWTIGRLLTWTTDYLSKNGVEESRLAAEVLLAHAQSCKRIDVYRCFNDNLPAEQQSAFRELVRRAAKHEPVAYIVGEKEFFSLSFIVTPDVLIPRPETETLVQCVIDHCTKAGVAAPKIIDIGTGSGCLAIALLRNLPEAVVVATDVSAPALDITRRNAERHSVSDRLTPLEASGLVLPQSVIPAEGFDMIVSNPPYVAKTEMPDLPPNVRDFEPRSALTDESDGLTLYRDIAERCRTILAPGGRVFVEVGDGAAQRVRHTMTSHGSLAYIGAWKDQITGSERVVGFEMTCDRAVR